MKPYVRYRYTQYAFDSWIPRSTAAHELRMARLRRLPIRVSRGPVGNLYVIDHGNRKETLSVNRYEP